MSVGPVFVLGAARSGTSICALGLTTGAGLPGYRESQVFPLLQRLLADVGDYFDSLGEAYTSESQAHFIAKVTRPAIEDRLSRMFLAFHESEFGMEKWVDKTPTSGMVNCVPLIARLYPEARFVFMKRRGIENLLSRQRKFPAAEFANLCNEWSACMQAWAEVQSVVTERSVEIDQADIALAPEEAAQKLTDLLDLSEEEHEGLLKVWKSERPEQTTVPREFEYIALEDTGWSSADQEEFKARCGPMMKLFGYGLDSEVRDCQEDRAGIALFYPVTDVDIVRENVTEKTFAPTPGGFLLHPNQPEKPAATVTYLGLEFDGENCFEATVKLMNEKAADVRFEVQVRDSESKAVLVEASTEVQPGTFDEWSFSFVPLKGRCDVRIKTEMADAAERSDGAWAIWLNPDFVSR